MTTKKRAGIVHRLLLSVLAVLLMAAAVPGTASAAPMPSSGSLTIHKYALEDMDSVGLPNDGNPATNIPSGAVPMGDVEFSVWQVDPGAASTAMTAAQAWPHIMASSLQTGITDAKGELTFPSLPQGIYYVAETGSSENTLLCDPFLVSVPMEDPAAAGSWITDVHVYPKNQSVEIDKFVAVTGTTDYYEVTKSLPVAAGERFNWYLRSQLPINMGTGSGESYVVSDTLSGYFDYQAGTVKVYTMPDSDSDLKDCTILGSGDYTVNFDTGTNTVSVELTAAGITRVKDLMAAGDRYSVIEYGCMVNDTAPQGVALYSGGKMEYTRDTTGASGLSSGGSQGGALSLLSAGDTVGLTRLANTGKTMTVEVAMEPEVHTGQIGLTKLADGTKALLPGAQFGVAKTKADALAGNFVATGTTDARGKLTFTGLEYGTPGDKPDENSNNTSYWLAETKAPDGYKLMKEPVEITFNYSQGEDGEYYFAQANVYNVKSDVSGETGTTSDKTGTLSAKTGDTSNLFVYLGLMALALAAVIVLIHRKRKAAEGTKQ